ncbi:hypothetical protein [Planctomycetes bacterium K23_9]|uniref:Uncharacterized protein n=1 Tax=Stieleria marina TaxID=1930275 RepID=A0A517NXU6_9BACT|nr:hypothetical protein K239x_39280 [Planctomycetes bacterium K23_9]
MAGFATTLEYFGGPLDGLKIWAKKKRKIVIHTTELPGLSPSRLARIWYRLIGREQPWNAGKVEAVYLLGRRHGLHGYLHIGSGREAAIKAIAMSNSTSPTSRSSTPETR